MRNAFTATVVSKSVTEEATVIGLQPDDSAILLESNIVRFVQTEDATAAGVAIDRFGGIMCAEGDTDVTMVATIDGVLYNATAAINLEEVQVGDTVNFTRGV